MCVGAATTECFIMKSLIFLLENDKKKEHKNQLQTKIKGIFGWIF